MYENRQVHHHFHNHPCLHCDPQSYIRMVQHLVERCLLLHLSREQCVRALDVHANIRPLVTLTVWRELQKENMAFFHAYHHAISPSPFIFTNRYIQRSPRVLAKSRRYNWKR